MDRDGRSGGLYEDPGGREALRYWDGRVWSPLLPPDIGEPRAAGQGPRSWSALPMTEGHWTGAKTAATRQTVRLALDAATSAGALAWALLMESGLYRGTHHGHWPVGVWLSVYACAAVFVLAARRDWKDRKFLLKVDQAANGPARRRR